MVTHIEEDPTRRGAHLASGAGRRRKRQIVGKIVISGRVDRVHRILLRSRDGFERSKTFPALARLEP
jgi:hypothetical protein